jgi:hypothetical protein
MGNGRGKKALFPGLELPAIAHSELAASAGFVAFDVPERDFPGIASRRVGNLRVDQIEICALGHVARSRRRLRTHRCHLKQQR